jgi:hypothetical protein
MLGNLLLDFSIKNNVRIEHRYLVVGHTHLECDAFHSCVEKKVRKIEVYTPAEYLEHIAGARTKSGKKLATKVHSMTFQDFKKYHLAYFKSIYSSGFEERRSSRC